MEHRITFKDYRRRISAKVIDELPEIVEADKAWEHDQVIGIKKLDGYWCEREYSDGQYTPYMLTVFNPTMCDEDEDDWFSRCCEHPYVCVFEPEEQEDIEEEED